MALGVMSLGGVLVYAGFRGVSPLEAMRDIASGHPTGITSQPLQLSAVGDVAAEAIAIANQQSGGGLRAAVVANAQKYVGDKYSQPKRQQAGYSDCSSFVDKCLKDAGIKPPFNAWANTTLYLASPDWKTVSQANALPGDIAVATGHMVLITASGGTEAIGQENSRINVRTGAVANLFSSSQHYVFKTWVGYTKQVAPPLPHTGASVS